jgi:hypothetical protein
MNKRPEGNEDWIKRGEGRTPTKGALAAERASAGLGTSDDEGGLFRESSSPVTLWAKRPPKSTQPRE